MQISVRLKNIQGKQDITIQPKTNKGEICDF